MSEPEPSQSPPRAAYILYRPKESEFRIAGISLLDRQLITLHRAGLGPITVITPDSVPSPPRAQSLSIPIRIAPHLPTERHPCVVVDGNVFFEQNDLVALGDNVDGIAAADGSRIDALFLDSPSEWAAQSEADGIPSKVKSRARNLNSAAEASEIGSRLLKATTSASDGIVDRFFNRPVSRLITRKLLETNASPNIVSLVAIAIGLVAGLLLAIPRQEFAVFGALLFQFSAVLDCSDGDIARLHFKESLLGKWLDIVGDQIVHIAIFVGIGFGLINASPSLAITLLTISAVAGAILAFATFLWASKRSENDPRINRYLQATANRDFSVVVLILACMGRLDIFAWLVGIGIHFYWISLLLISIKSSNQARA